MRFAACVVPLFALLACASDHGSGGPAPGSASPSHDPVLFVIPSRSTALATGDDPVVVTTFIRGGDGRVVADGAITFDPTGSVPSGLARDRYGVTVGTLTSTSVGSQVIRATGGGLGAQAQIVFQATTPWRPVARDLSSVFGDLFIDPTDPDLLLVGGFETPNGGVSWMPWASGAAPHGPSWADPVDAGVYFSVDEQPGGCLWRSDDWGSTWAQVLCGQFDVSFDPSQPGTVYAMGWPNGQPTAAMLSTDDGVDWQPLDIPVLPVGANVTRIEVVPGSAPELAFVSAPQASPMQLWTSTDGGTSWTAHAGPPAVGVPAAGPRAFEVFAADPQTFFVCDPNALWKTSDGGSTWTVSHQSSGPLLSTRCSFSLDRSHPSVALLADLPSNALLRTIDGGATWTPVIENLRVTDVTFDPQHDDTAFAATGRGVLKSTDNGVTWTDASTGLPLDASGALLSVASSGHGVVLMQVPGGLYRSADSGLTWSRLDAYPKPASQVSPTARVMAEPDANTIVVLPLTAQVPQPTTAERSADGGATWQEVALPTGVDDVAAAPDQATVLYAASSALPGAFLASSDGGASWTSMALPVAGRASVHAGAQGTVFLVMRDVGTSQLVQLYVSHDHGGTWQATQLPAGAGGPVSVSDLAADPADPMHAWALASTQEAAPRSLYVTHDGGATWTMLASSSPLPADSWSGPLVAPDDPNVLCVSGGGNAAAAYISKDGGITWQPLTAPGGDIAIVSATTFVAGAKDGLYRTASAGL